MMCGKRLRLAKLRPLLELTTSSTRCRSRPARRAATITSAVAASVTALRKLLSSFVVCPEPTAPMCATRELNAASTPRTASSARSSPPAMIVSVPFSAAAAPPEIPASSRVTPRCASTPARRTVELGLEVLRSTTICPARAAGAIPPSTTGSTTLESGSERSSTSLASTSAASDAASIPAAAARDGSVSWPATRYPAAAILEAIRPPILPRPTTPIRCSAIAWTLAGTLARVRVDLLLDARAELAEGPVWDGETLTWVDQLAGVVNRLGLDGVAGPALAVGGRVGCALPRSGGGLVLGTQEGFASERGLLARVELPAGAFVNDGRCDALGRLWAGSIAVAAGGGPVRGGGALHRLDPDLRVSVARTGVTLSNGLDWSPDGRTL